MQHTDSRVAAMIAAECLGSRVSRLHRLIARRFEQALAPTGLTLPQLEVLTSLIVIGEPQRPRSLADLLGVERSTMSRNLDALEGAGLVAVAARSPTGRAMRFVITDKGRNAERQAEQAWRTVQDELLANLGKDAPGTIDSWLEQIASTPTPETTKRAPDEAG